MMSNPTTGQDWTTSFHGHFREAFLEVIRDLRLSGLQRYPPPKTSGLLFGHEARILRRFLSAQSSLLDPSAFSEVYRSLASSRERRLYEAFVLGEPLPPSVWSDLVGPEVFSQWRENSLLHEHDDCRVSCRFRVISIGDVTVVVDPLIVTPISDSFPNRVHIGQDTLNLLENLSRLAGGGRERVLEVGPGSGMILISLARIHRDAVGIEVNPRAVRLARLNAELNRSLNCHVHEGDVFQIGTTEDAFDLVVWNAPFMFLPETQKERNVDGYGGDLGIGVTLRFLELLPALLHPRGAAYIESTAPVLDDGENRLEVELSSRAARLQLDITNHVMQFFWVPKLRSFHRSHGIRRFEAVLLEITHGSGRVERIAPHLTRRAIDTARGWFHGARL